MGDEVRTQSSSISEWTAQDKFPSSKPSISLSILAEDIVVAVEKELYHGQTGKDNIGVSSLSLFLVAIGHPRV
ncbi:hypothetical protein QCA50_003450 [Cerrena zonata]|uniref:Uncharacterized protein n=1 Tax=Cerrena zonata TaxID=2478898 RepID=A0AAW0GMM7_9APHY